MAREHTWGVKRVEKKYYTVCKDCGVSDKAFDTEVQANNRIAYLKVLGVKPSKLQKLFPKRLF